MIIGHFLLALALCSNLEVLVESCPIVSSVNPTSGSADPSFVYSIVGIGFNDVNSLNSTAGLLHYTVGSQMKIQFSFQAGSSAMGRVEVILMPSSNSSCSAETVTIFVTIPCQCLAVHVNLYSVIVFPVFLQFLLYLRLLMKEL